MFHQSKLHPWKATFKCLLILNWSLLSNLSLLSSIVSVQCQAASCRFLPAAQYLHRIHDFGWTIWCCCLLAPCSDILHGIAHIGHASIYFLQQQDIERLSPVHNSSEHECECEFNRSMNYWSSSRPTWRPAENNHPYKHVCRSHVL